MKDTKNTIKDRGFWKKDVEVGVITGNRHHVIFPERNGVQTSVTFCNYCGSSFTVNNKCSNCGVSQ